MGDAKEGERPPTVSLAKPCVPLAPASQLHAELGSSLSPSCTVASVEEVDEDEEEEDDVVVGGGRIGGMFGALSLQEEGDGEEDESSEDD